MKKRSIYYIIAIVIVSITAMVFSVFAQNTDDRPNIDFLKNYGWEVSGASIECVDINIPDPFDLVYQSYNKMQIEAGLDLSPYKGCEAKRYTYIISNYPKDVGEEVRANIICVNDIPVAGDIMTVSINGFMHSLVYPQ